MADIHVYMYPRCGTCRKAKAWLDEHEVAYDEIHIVENPPDIETLRDLWQKSNLPLKSFFNTSGKKYRELGLKDKLADMSDEQKLELLSSDGMLIKRPIVTDGRQVTVGFRAETFADVWAK